MSDQEKLSTGSAFATFYVLVVLAVICSAIYGVFSDSGWTLIAFPLCSLGGIIWLTILAMVEHSEDAEAFHLPTAAQAILAMSFISLMAGMVMAGARWLSVMTGMPETTADSLAQSMIESIKIFTPPLAEAAAASALAIGCAVFLLIVNMIDRGNKQTSLHSQTGSRGGMATTAVNTDDLQKEIDRLVGALNKVADDCAGPLKSTFSDMCSEANAMRQSCATITRDLSSAHQVFAETKRLTTETQTLFKELQNMLVAVGTLVKRLDDFFVPSNSRPPASRPPTSASGGAGQSGTANYRSGGGGQS